MTRLTLRRGHDHRLRRGHPWVFSNEVATLDGPAEPGTAVEIVAADGWRFGTGYYNPHSLIAARLLTRDTLRLVHGEGDALPGLVVDRYADVLSVQLLTQGMDVRRASIVAALRELLDPRAIVARNDSPARELEGLPRRVELLHGETPSPVTVTINGLRLAVDVVGGQKTGLFLDQRDNCRSLQGLVKRGDEVLDLFCYAGAWSLHAASYGAGRVTGVDASAAAIGQAQENARLNRFDQRCQFVTADIFDFLRAQPSRQYATVILDPPAFIKNRRQVEAGKKGYLTVNRRALELVASGGFLVTCSCSHHLARSDFVTLIAQAAHLARRTVRLVELRGPAGDHPIRPECPETDYLKCAFLFVD